MKKAFRLILNSVCLHCLVFQVEPNQVSHAILLNNAGSIGDISNRIKDMTNIRAESLQDYFNLNISSPMFLM